MPTGGPRIASLDEVLIVADAGPDAGLGHIVRCSAIAAALCVRGVRSRNVAVGAQKIPESLVAWDCVERHDEIPTRAPALLVLDSYHIDPVSARTQTNATRLVAMHDFGPLPEQADLVLTTDPGLAKTRPGVVGGLGLSCLGPSYWGLPEVREVPPQVRTALVTTGGGDPGGHAVTIAHAVRGVLPRACVVLVRGVHARFPDVDDIRVLNRPSSMFRPLLEADLAVTGAGNTLLEALAVGTPTVALLMAENQRAVAEGVARRGATELLSPDAYELIESAVRQLAGDSEVRRSRARLGQELVDGYGALRAAFLIARLLEN